MIHVHLQRSVDTYCDIVFGELVDDLEWSRLVGFRRDNRHQDRRRIYVGLNFHLQDSVYRGLGSDPPIPEKGGLISEACLVLVSGTGVIERSLSYHGLLAGCEELRLLGPERGARHRPPHQEETQAQTW